VSSIVLPKDLPSAIKRLQDRELDLLLAAVLAEQEHGRLPAASCLAKKSAGAASVAGGEPAGGLSNGAGSRADAVENRSGVVDRVRPFAHTRIMPPSTQCSKGSSTALL